EHAAKAAAARLLRPPAKTRLVTGVAMDGLDSGNTGGSGTQEAKAARHLISEGITAVGVAVVDCSHCIRQVFRPPGQRSKSRCARISPGREHTCRRLRHERDHCGGPALD